MRRLAVLSLHTSPLAQPGSGDSGGMNVYVRELVSALAQAGIDCTTYVRRWRADLPDEVTARLRTLAARVFEAVGCEGLARVDFFLMPDGELVVNEINTMPGFTPTSMFPRMWAATGVDYPALVERLIQLALVRDTGLR